VVRADGVVALVDADSDSGMDAQIVGVGGEIPAAAGDELPDECEPVDGMILRTHEIGTA
jgi:hypothetical protein